jgi:hypothetical protein
MLFKEFFATKYALVLHFMGTSLNSNTAKKNKPFKLQNFLQPESAQFSDLPQHKKKNRTIWEQNCGPNRNQKPESLYYKQVGMLGNRDMRNP